MMLLLCRHYSAGVLLSHCAIDNEIHLQSIGGGLVQIICGMWMSDISFMDTEINKDTIILDIK